MPVDLSPLPSKLRRKADELAEHIIFDKLIAKGDNGYVLVGDHRILDRKVVVKFYYWGNGDHAEPAHLARMDSDHILKVYHAESIDDDDAFFITPFCERGDLDDAISDCAMGPLEALDAILQISSGVSYLHGHGYLHRDLKPSNIFCLGGHRYLIGDFGSVAQKNSDGYARTVTRHSLLYRPPEEIQERISYEQGDIYQIGLVFFQLLGGYLPYEESAWLSPRQKLEYNALADPDRQLFATAIIESKIIRGKIANLETLPSWTPRTLSSVIRKCLKINRDDRFHTVADLIAKLNNIRGRIPDWRIVDGIPVLCRARARFRIVEDHRGLRIEKFVNGGQSWRRERSLTPTSLQDAVAMAETL